VLFTKLLSNRLHGPPSSSTSFPDLLSPIPYTQNLCSSLFNPSFRHHLWRSYCVLDSVISTGYKDENGMILILKVFRFIVNSSMTSPHSMEQWHAMVKRLVLVIRLPDSCLSGQVTVECIFLDLFCKQQTVVRAASTCYLLTRIKALHSFTWISSCSTYQCPENVIFIVPILNVRNLHIKV
jgi:hypothetical protein